MPEPTHAGGVIVRVLENRTEVLLVRARPAPHDWVLPKGHIEAGETPEICARREIREEAAVDATVLDRLGEDEFTTPGGKFVRAVFFLMRYERDVIPLEQRERRWFPVDEALVSVGHENPRELIRLAVRRTMKTRAGVKSRLPY
jgi:8-oxo-dGTP pyrophosphatase MutT (NUDIX family)